MTLDGVMSFLQIHVNVSNAVQLLAETFFSAVAKSCKKMKTSNVFSSFIVC